MKRDLNYIKHIKPQIKEKEQKDRMNKGAARFSRECKLRGIDPEPKVDIVECMSLFKVAKRLLDKYKEHP